MQTIILKIIMFLLSMLKLEMVKDLLLKVYTKLRDAILKDPDWYDEALLEVLELIKNLLNLQAQKLKK